ncbi:hypothetical protein [Williamsia sp. DF01-3]|uniref:hypothetical protein n=1 Tax=Williamsia sp. DF01-3 TaxID=2934157 RepID=UPI001FF4E1C1|nr:hypothetical protein [Williamsia sp. DF01-3]MCK0518360.1 hypothetical protein [Williamsia sp. DF01-3]
MQSSSSLFFGEEQQRARITAQHSGIEGVELVDELTDGCVHRKQSRQLPSSGLDLLTGEQSPCHVVTAGGRDHGGATATSEELRGLDHRHPAFPHAQGPRDTECELLGDEIADMPGGARGGRHKVVTEERRTCRVLVVDKPLYAIQSHPRVGHPFVEGVHQLGFRRDRQVRDRRTGPGKIPVEPAEIR